MLYYLFYLKIIFLFKYRGRVWSGCFVAVCPSVFLPCTYDTFSLLLIYYYTVDLFIIQKKTNFCFILTTHSSTDTIDD